MTTSTFVDDDRSTGDPGTQGSTPMPRRPPSDGLGPANLVAAYVVTLVLVPARFTVGALALTVSMLIAIVAGLVWLNGFNSIGSRAVFIPSGRALVLFACVALFSHLVTDLRTSSLVADADRRLVATIATVVVALVTIDGIRTRAAIHRVIGALVAAGAITAGIGIVQYSTGFDLAADLRPPGFADSGTGGFIFRRVGFRRVAGTARHPIEFGVVLAMIIPFAIYLSSWANGVRARRFAAIGAITMAVALPMALSRAGVLAAGGALLVLVPSWRPSQRLRLLGSSVIALSLLTLLAPGLLSGLADLFVGESASGSNAARSQAAEAAVGLFRGSPVVGRGLGGAEDLIVDNQYLLTMVEAGAIGILSILLLFNSVVLTARRVRRTVVDPAMASLAVTLAGSCVAFAIAGAGLATFVFPTTGGLLFVIVGLAGATWATADLPMPGLPTPTTTHPVEPGTAHDDVTA